MQTSLAKYKPLYLKYRPQSLGELVGQTSVAKTLTNAIDNNRLTHAYLFTGPRGTGKTSSARILAKSLNCQNGPTANPCGKCTNCEEIKEGNSTAVFELDAASNNSVDDARVLIERAPLVAVGGRFKFYIIDECHMLTKEAFNALLKTIEEPPANVVFVLATTEEHKVPQTIISRCQKLMFRLVGAEELSQYLAKIAKLEGLEMEPETLALIARRSGGSLRDALSLLDQAGLLAEPGKPVTVNDLLSLLGAVHEDVLLEISKHLLDKQASLVLAALHKLLSEGREPAVIAQELSIHFLNLTKAACLSAASQLNEAELSSPLNSLIVGSASYITSLCEQAKAWDNADLAQIVERLDRLESTCRRTTQPATHLEMGLLSICHRHEIGMVRQLQERLESIEARLTGDAYIPPAAPQQAVAPTPRTAPASQPIQQAPIQPAPAPAPQVQPIQPAQAPQIPQVQQIPQAQQIPPAAPIVQAPIAQAPTTQVPVVQSTIEQSQAAATPVTPISEAQESQPQVAPPPAVLSQAAEEPSDSQIESSDEPAEVSSVREPAPDNLDLDYTWDQILEYLDSHHKPTHSLLSLHACCLGLTSKDITVGLFSDNLQKLVENKVSHIKAAAEAILARPIVVKIKVVSKEATKPPQSKSAARQMASLQSAPPSNPSSLGSPPQAALSGPGPNNNAPKKTEEITSRQSFNRAPVAGTTGGASNQSSPGANYSGLKGPNSTTDSGTIKEAYKLFDGPGSRFIS
jgi:DNA polymerase-3 subunit gamma/tau